LHIPRQVNSVTSDGIVTFCYNTLYYLSSYSTYVSYFPDKTSCKINRNVDINRFGFV